MNLLFLFCLASGNLKADPLISLQRLQAVFQASKEPDHAAQTAHALRQAIPKQNREPVELLFKRGLLSSGANLETVLIWTSAGTLKRIQIPLDGDRLDQLTQEARLFYGAGAQNHEWLARRLSWSFQPQASSILDAGQETAAWKKLLFDTVPDADFLLLPSEWQYLRSRYSAAEINKWINEMPADAHRIWRSRVQLADSLEQAAISWHWARTGKEITTQEILKLDFEKVRKYAKELGSTFDNDTIERYAKDREIESFASLAHASALNLDSSQRIKYLDLLRQAAHKKETDPEPRIQELSKRWVPVYLEAALEKAPTNLSRAHLFLMDAHFFAQNSNMGAHYSPQIAAAYIELAKIAFKQESGFASHFWSSFLNGALSQKRMYGTPMPPQINEFGNMLVERYIQEARKEYNKPPSEKHRLELIFRNLTNAEKWIKDLGFNEEQTRPHRVQIQELRQAAFPPSVPNKP